MVATFVVMVVAAATVEGGATTGVSVVVATDVVPVVTDVVVVMTSSVVVVSVSVVVCSSVVAVVASVGVVDEPSEHRK